MRLLLIEDDAAIAGAVAALLRAQGHACDVCATLACASAAVDAEPFDAVLLDLGLPDGDGVAWLRARRAAGWRTPVLIVTARDAVPERVAGLDSGADDYLVKPFAPEELLARLRVALRRSGGEAGGLLEHGALRVDPARRTVTLDGQPVTLGTKEFALLWALLRARGRVLTRAQLESTLYGFDEVVESNALEVHIHHLRRKLGSTLIQTVRGVGYTIPAPPSP
ncbi:MAG: winged helix-turn-helix domain-containing protein [Tepidimonas ignava]|jgi:DNA-binding response OmpR family regulator|uniref:Transcriptional regulatory protein QseB n=1 Tax=Tepidimonas ignava TaxID=114249 RepID=A0A4R3LH40_9BURK|nr:response regulator transcription factor [Tepidimonas ignava]TCS99511.1 winged helix family two component transcriptional regulator [Tepidimonas ignava]TSE22011.1 Transcriptional regulatory protein QseB [Tepidimonas ignava]